MIIAILYWISIWFASGIMAQLLLSIVNGIVNKKWPIRFNDATLFFLAGLFGFISVGQLIWFGISIIGNVVFNMATDLEEEYDTEETEEEVLLIRGLTTDETDRVREFAKALVANRVPEQEKQQDVE
jgi:Zn-dependent membrane protease YugP